MASVAHLLHAHTGGVVLLGSLNELLHHRLAGTHDVVTQEHGKGLVPHKAAGTGDGVAQTLGLLLPDIEDVGQVGGTPDLGQLLLLAGLVQPGLQLGVVVKIVVHGRLGPVGDNQNVLDTGGYGLFDDVLNDRLVHHGQHLLGHRFGGGEHAGAEAGGGNDSFTDLHSENLQLMRAEDRPRFTGVPDVRRGSWDGRT